MGNNIRIMSLLLHPVQLSGILLKTLQTSYSISRTEISHRRSDLPGSPTLSYGPGTGSDKTE